MRLLLVADVSSSHTARWISQINDLGWDIHIFDPHDRWPHTELRNVTVHSCRRYRLRRQGIIGAGWYPFVRGVELLTHHLPGRVPILKDALSPGKRLAAIIDRVRPLLIHSLRAQDEGYTVLAVKKVLGDCLPVPWIHSTWGNDFYFYGRLTEHAKRVTALASNCDYLITDCERDIDLAHKHGFSGTSLGVFPGPGGFHTAEILRSLTLIRPSERRIITLKGYQGLFGRAHVAIEALANCRRVLTGYAIVAYSAGRTLCEVAQKLDVPIRTEPYLSQSALVELKSRARAGIALSISDGTPNGMLESMLAGACPIQSETAAVTEWIIPGVNGLVVPPEDPQVLADAVVTALTDDTLVDRAAELNREMLPPRIDISIVKPQVIEAYKRVAGMT